MVNKVMLIGNLGRNPELRSTQSGRAVANVTLATNRRWRDAQGQKQEETEWHSLVFWGRQAELADRLLSSGRRIYVEGRLQTTSWHDTKTGDKRYRTEVVCQNFQLLDAPPGAAPSGAPMAPTPPDALGAMVGMDEHDEPEEVFGEPALGEPILEEQVLEESDMPPFD